jgi:hypothetical protein
LSSGSLLFKDTQSLNINDVLVDVSVYAHDVGIANSMRVRISPSVLRDINDIPETYYAGGQRPITRLMKIMGQLRNLWATVRLDLGLGHDDVTFEFETVIAFGSKDPDGILEPYKLKAEISDTDILVMTVSETSDEINTSEQTYIEVQKLKEKLGPPRSLTFLQLEK